MSNSAASNFQARSRRWRVRWLSGSVDSACSSFGETGANVMKHILRNAFTLLELLIVVLIIALIASMLLPAINKAKQQAKLAKCTSNLRQLGLAVRMYLDDSGGYFFKY